MLILLEYKDMAYVLYESYNGKPFPMYNCTRRYRNALSSDDTYKDDPHIL